ncbi:MAG TPA: hypothetical protein VFV52_07200, partial [Bacilli bacterium]|nr:hypothetical protein [Bacilli bacterium]
VEQIAFDGTTFKRTDFTMPWNLEYIVTSDRPLTLEVTSKSDDKVKLIVSDVSEGLPTLSGQTFLPRSESFMSEGEFDQSTIVSKTFEY